MQVEDVRTSEKEAQPDLTAASVDQKTLVQAKGGREIKDKLSELFNPHKFKPRPVSEGPPPAAPTEQKKERGHLDWAAGFMPRSRAEISEAGRQAFTATCHLLLECTTFPIYLSEKETLDLHTHMFGNTGQHREVIYPADLILLSATYFKGGSCNSRQKDRS